MITTSNSKRISFLVFLYSFFLYSGYFICLAIAIKFLGYEYTRLTTIPLRAITTLIALGLILYFHIKKCAARIKIPILMMIFFLLLYALLIELNINNQNYRTSETEYFFYILIYCITPLIFFSTINFNIYAKEIINGFLFSGLILGITVTVIYWQYLVGGVGRISMALYDDPDAVFLSPISLSYASALTISMVFYALKQKNFYKINKFYLFFALIVSIPPFLLGASRGSVIALILVMLHLLMSADGVKKFKIIISTISFLCVLILLSTAFESSVFDRFLKISEATTSTDDSFARIDMWSIAWSYFLDSPLVGGYIELDGFSPHNFILEILMSTGIFGFFLFAIPLFYSVLIINRKKKNSASSFILIVAINTIVQHLFSGNIASAILLFSFIGMSFSLRSDQ